MTDEILYSEVLDFINMLGDKYKEKLPRQLIEFFEKNKNPDYVLTIDLNKPIIPQFKHEQTEAMLEYLNLQYWCTQEEKDELLKIYKENDIKRKENLKEKYNVDNLFHKEKSRLINNLTENNSNSENTSTTLTKYKENLFERVKRFIKRWLFLK